MSLEVVISSSNTCEGSDESSTAKEFESTSAEVIAELKSIDVDAKFDWLVEGNTIKFDWLVEGNTFKFDWLVEGNTIKFDWLVGGNTIKLPKSFADDSKDHVE